MITPNQAENLKKGDMIEYTSSKTGKKSQWVVDYPMSKLEAKSKMDCGSHSVPTAGGGGECISHTGCLRVSKSNPDGRGAARMSLLISDFQDWDLMQNVDPTDPTDPDDNNPESPVTPDPITLTSLSPLPATVDVPLNSTIIFTFSGPVTAKSGNITITDGVTPIVIAVNAAAVNIASNVVTVTPTTQFAPDTSYTVTVGANAFTDESGTSIDVLGGNTYSFTTVAE